MIGKIELALILGLVGLVVVFALSTHEYKRLYKADETAIKVQNQAIEEQKKEAAQLLATMTKERDERQAKIDAFSTTLGKKDETAVTQIKAAAVANTDVPVRVRYVYAPAGSCGPGTGGQASQGTGPGKADAGTASGVLAPENQRRLELALTDIETLQAAFNSCKAQLEFNGSVVP